MTEISLYESGSFTSKKGIVFNLVCEDLSLNLERKTQTTTNETEKEKKKIFEHQTMFFKENPL